MRAALKYTDYVARLAAAPLNDTYKGVVFCEGVNDLALKVLPKKTDEDTKNATC